MRVVLNTHDRLVLRDLRLGIALVLVAVVAVPGAMAWGYARAGVLPGFWAVSAVALVLFLGCFGAFVRPITITLDRPGGTVTVVERGLFGTRRAEYALADIRGATLESRVIKWRSGGSGSRRSRRRLSERRTWRAALSDRKGNTLPLSQIYGGEAGAQTAAAAINGWIGEELVAAGTAKAG